MTRGSWRSRIRIRSSRTDAVAVAVRARTGRTTVAFEHLVQPEVGRTEIVAPFRGAMGFVDGKERDPRLGERRPQLLSRQGFGSRHHQKRTAFRDALHGLSASLAPNRAVDPHHRNPTLVEIPGLVLKKRQERGNHDHRLRKNHRRDLVTRGFSIPRGQNHQRVAALQAVENRPLLLGMEAFDPQALGGLDELRLGLGIHGLGDIGDGNEFRLLDLNRFHRGRRDRRARRAPGRGISTPPRAPALPPAVTSPTATTRRPLGGALRSRIPGSRIAPNPQRGSPSAPASAFRGSSFPLLETPPSTTGRRTPARRFLASGGLRCSS